MANLIERVVGDFGDKRRWRACKARLAATSVLDEITAALRAAQADTLRRLPSGRLDPPGPATLLLDADLRIQGSTSGMEDRLRRLLPAAQGLAPVPAAALNVAAQLLAVEAGVDGHDPQARTHLGDGRWVAVRAARLWPSGTIIVSVEPTTPAERLDLFVRAFGLTAREADVVGRVARGDWTPRRLHMISTWRRTRSRIT